MNPMLGYDRCLSFINCQVQPGTTGPLLASHFPPRHAVTISRQTGSGGHAVAEYLADFLQGHTSPSECPWTVFDRNLVEKVIEEHHLPRQMARFMNEDRMSELTDTIDALFDLHPSSWSLVRQVSETILHLAEAGNVILIGRAGHIITSNLSHVLHVRLVAPIEKRIDCVMLTNQVDKKAAIDHIKTEDLGRERYLRKYFNRDINDPLQYHLIINTSLVGYQNAARMIGESVLKMNVRGSIASSSTKPTAPLSTVVQPGPAPAC